MRAPWRWVIAITASLTLVAPRPAAADPQQPDDRGTQTLVDTLGADRPLPVKEEASRKLVERGTAALPLLIAALHDTRVYERRDISNRMNLPPNAPPPKPVIATITVGDRCRDLLYRIITPTSSSPGRFKVFSTQILQIDDWDAWWEANRHKTLAQIHDDLRPLVDEYWNQHGTTQKVRIEK